MQNFHATLNSYISCFNSQSILYSTNNLLPIPPLRPQTIHRRSANRSIDPCSIFRPQACDIICIEHHPHSIHLVRCTGDTSPVLSRLHHARGATRIRFNLLPLFINVVYSRHSLDSVLLFCLGGNSKGGS